MTKIRSKLGLMESNLATGTMCERIDERNFEYEGVANIHMFQDLAQTIKHIKINSYLKDCDVDGCTSTSLIEAASDTSTAIQYGAFELGNADLFFFSFLVNVQVPSFNQVLISFERKEYGTLILW